MAEEGIDYYEAKSIAEDEAAQARRQVLSEVEDMFRIEREDRRESAADIRQGISELNERIWNIEVKLGIREPSGKWIGYGEEE